jgi:hypothetical protein
LGLYCTFESNGIFVALFHFLYWLFGAIFYTFRFNLLSIWCQRQQSLSIPLASSHWLHPIGFIPLAFWCCMSHSYPFASPSGVRVSNRGTEAVPIDQLLLQYWLEGPEEDEESSASVLGTTQQSDSAAAAAAQVLLGGGGSRPRGPLPSLNGSSSSDGGDNNSSNSLNLLDPSKVAAAQIVMMCNDVTTAVGELLAPSTCPCFLVSYTDITHEPLLLKTRVDKGVKNRNDRA